MKTYLLPALIALCTLAVLAPCAKADKAAPPIEKENPPAANPPKKEVAGLPVALKIRAVKGLGETSLQIPRKVIKIVDPHGDAGADVQSRGISPAQTIVAGVALSVSLGLGGLQLARRRNSRGGMIFIALIAVAAGALAASQVLADRAPANTKPAPKEEGNGRTVAMPAVVQILESGEVVELNLDLDRAKEMLADEAKK